jgi:hypothetical protein
MCRGRPSRPRAGRRVARVSWDRDDPASPWETSHVLVQGQENLLSLLSDPYFDDTAVPAPAGARHQPKAAQTIHEARDVRVARDHPLGDVPARQPRRVAATENAQDVVLIGGEAGRGFEKLVPRLGDAAAAIRMPSSTSCSREENARFCFSSRATPPATAEDNSRVNDYCQEAYSRGGRGVGSLDPTGESGSRPDASLKCAAVAKLPIAMCQSPTANWQSAIGFSNQQFAISNP